MTEFEASLSGMDSFEADSMLRSSAGLLVVHSVDWSQRTLSGEVGWFLDPEVYSGKTALMYNRELVTDFIFDGGEPPWRSSVSWWRSYNYDAIHVSRDGYWGMVDRNGNTVLPFIFEDIVRIDEVTAFARIDGRYGILGFYPKKPSLVLSH